MLAIQYIFDWRGNLSFYGTELLTVLHRAECMWRRDTSCREAVCECVYLGAVWTLPRYASVSCRCCRRCHRWSLVSDAVSCQVAGAAVQLRAVRAGEQVGAARHVSALTQRSSSAVHRPSSGGDSTQQRGQQVVEERHLLTTVVPVRRDVTSCCSWWWDEVILSIVRRQRLLQSNPIYLVVIWQVFSVWRRRCGVCVYKQHNCLLKE